MRSHLNQSIPRVLQKALAASPIRYATLVVSMKTRTLRLLVVVVSSILQLIGISIFARGFFPYKKVLPGFATRNGAEDFKHFGLNPLDAPPKLFDRLVFIVIDALRRFVLLDSILTRK